ncbi:ABC transporter substrate-binding protein [Paenibacillus agricola]|uniref:Extracellular solute-binding protein n=1 Tax=Paenibacillus agricola TaxID=2716264 RepID=A0ABX0J219_9BACL|nr:extracellular solute-binding protein [Paenibacillus agricola]NHN30335.1 extracellular solute-binding protein [Paenibacillus agricola]
MKSNKKKNLLLAMLAFSLVLTACSKAVETTGTGTPAKDTPTAATPADMRIMWWGADDRHQATTKVLDMYSAKNTNIKFTSEYMAWDGFWAKLPTLAASNSMTDILQMDGAYINEYAKKGLLMDLSDVDLKGLVDPRIVNNVKIDGKLYGIPLSHNGSGIAYNKTELEAAGVKLPKKDWTWDEYFAFVKEAHEKLPKGKYAFTDNTSVWDWYQFYQTSNGKGPIMQDGTKFNLDKDLWFKFQNMHEQWRADGSLPSAETSSAYKDNDPKADAMVSGVMARAVTVGSVGVMETLNPGKIAVVNNPVGPSGGGWAQATIFLSMSKSSKYAVEGKKFLQYFISDPEAGKTLGLTRGVPINDTIYKALEPTLSKKDLMGKELLATALDKALPFYPAPQGWSDFVSLYKAEMESVMFKKQTIEQAYDKIVAKGKETEAKLNKK